MGQRRRKEGHRPDRLHHRDSNFATLIFTILSTCVGTTLDENEDLTAENDAHISINSVLTFCFTWIILKRYNSNIVLLIIEIESFEKYYPRQIVEKIEMSIKRMCKIFLIYALLVAGVYSLIPLLFIKTCTPTEYMQKYGIPCWVLVKFVLPFGYDSFVLSVTVALVQVILMFTIALTLGISACMVYAFTKHISENFKNLQTLILNLEELLECPDELKCQIKICIDYHNDIINLTSKVLVVINKITVININFTAPAVALISYELLGSTSVINRVRYPPHLAAWVIGLFSSCHMGQALFESSTGVGSAVMMLSLHEMPVETQKDLLLILLRSQKPLAMSALGMSVIGYKAFFATLRTAAFYIAVLYVVKN